jgi:hypothetical protein
MKPQLMTRDEARQFVRSGGASYVDLLNAHGTILSGGMIGAGDSAKLIEIADAVSALCFVAAQTLERKS